MNAFLHANNMLPVIYLLTCYTVQHIKIIKKNVSINFQTKWTYGHKNRKDAGAITIYSDRTVPAVYHRADVNAEH